MSGGASVWSGPAAAIGRTDSRDGKATGRHRLPAREALCYVGLPVPPGARRCASRTIPTARACRSSSTRRPTASSRRCRSRPCTTDAQPSGARGGDRATRAPRARRGARSWSPRAAPRRTLLAMNAAYAARRPPRRLLRRADARRRSTCSSRARRSTASEFIFDVQGHFVNPTGAWTRSGCRRGARPLRSMRQDAALRAGERGPGELDYLHCIGPDAVRQGRLPRFGHRPDGAVLRAVDARGRAADDRGGGRDRAHRRAARRHASAAAARPRQPEPARRPRRHGRARRSATASRAWKTYTQWGPGRQGLLPRRRRRHRDDREGAQARRAQHRDPQGAAVRPRSLRALDLRRHRPRREALSRRQLPRSTTRASSPAQPKGPYDPSAQRRHRRAGHEPRSTTASSPAPTCTPSSARPGAS